MTTLRRVLERTREILDEDHWVKGGAARLYNMRGERPADGEYARCLIGGIDYTCSSLGAPLDVQRQAYDVVADCIKEGKGYTGAGYSSGSTIVEYNDYKAEHQDIVDVLDCAIAKTEGVAA